MITTHENSQTIVVHAAKTIDALKVEYYRHKLKALIDKGYQTLIFDLDKTDYVNSSALGLFVELYNLFKDKDATFRLINCNEFIHSLLAQTNLQALLVADDADPQSEAPQVHATFDSLHAFMSTEILLLAQINDIVRKALELHDPKMIAQVSTDGVVGALQADRGAMFLLDSKGTALKLAHWCDPTQTFSAPDLGSVPLKPGNLETRLLEEKQVFLSELSSDEKLPAEDLFVRMGFHHILGVAISGKMRDYGLFVLEVNARTVRRIRSLRPLISTLAGLFGLALEKATMAQELEQSNRQLAETMERLARSHQSLIDAGRLAALGTVISGIGHQLNNKLVPVLGYSQLLAVSQEIPPKIQKKMQAIRDSTKDMQSIIDKLLTVSGVREPMRTRLNLHERLEVALDLMACHIRDNKVEVDLELTPDPVEIESDADLLLQALLAIVHRACTSFHREGVRPWLRIVTTVSASNVRLIFEDNGDGLDQYDQEDWLDPLIPLEAMSNGRLFSYRIPRSVIRRHQGTLNLQERKEGGKRVIIDLPLKSERSAQVIEAPPPEPGME